MSLCANSLLIVAIIILVAATIVFLCLYAHEDFRAEFRAAKSRFMKKLGAKLIEKSEPNKRKKNL